MRDREIQALIRSLRRIREERYLSIKGLAYLLGVSAGHLSMIFAGKRRPGIYFVRAAMRAFPEIRRELADSLRCDLSQSLRDKARGARSAGKGV